MEKQKNITKDEKGHYYERIVTWKEKPNIANYILSFFYLFLSAGIIVGVQYDPLLDKLGGTLIGFMAGIIFCIFLYGVYTFSGKGRQVKFRRIK